MRLVVLAWLAGGCVAVQPWRREDHAQRSMVVRFGDDGLSGKERSKLLETKAGGGSPWVVPGGGCGCSQ